MKTLPLRWKIILIAVVPLFFFAAISAGKIWESFLTYRETSQVAQNMEVVELISAAVHETQVERGKTSIFLNGAIPLSDLNAQRSSVDEKLKNLGQKVSRLALAASAKEELLENMKRYGDLRAAVSAKQIPGDQALRRYSEIVGKFLAIEGGIAAATTIGSIKSPLYSLTILEDAKESAGKLRAQVSGVLSQDAAFEGEKFMLISSLKGKVDSGLTSPALVVTESSRRQIEQFFASSEWKEVTRVFGVVLSQAKVGKYGVEPKSFFQTITAAIGQLQVMVVNQQKFVTEQALTASVAARKTLWWNSIFLALAVSALSAIAIFMAMNISKVLTQITNDLSSRSDQVASSSNHIAASGTQLSAATTEQAAALQETVASVDEISAMVAKNAEAAERARALTAESRETTGGGQDSVKEMMAAMDEIEAGNTKVMGEVERSNAEISEIVGMIQGIAEKTKIINDIVFQTKLLSFNASVEAARAGEHGKGFAVVAEEVGKLAQMSGEASKEIFDMLGSSTERVEVIAKTSQQRIGQLMVQNKEKVDRGIEMAGKCGGALDKIIENAQRVHEVVDEIATASKEQAQGIHEITKAMAQLDQVTQQNSSVSHQSSNAAAELSDQAEGLRSVVVNLFRLIEGRGRGPAHGPGPGESVAHSAEAEGAHVSQDRMSA